MFNKITKRTGFFGGTYLEDSHGNTIDFNDDSRRDGGSMAGDLIGGTFGLIGGTIGLAVAATGAVAGAAIDGTGHAINGGKWLVRKQREANDYNNPNGRSRDEMNISYAEMVRDHASKQDLIDYAEANLVFSELFETEDGVDVDFEDLSKDELKEIIFDLLVNKFEEQDEEDIQWEIEYELSSVCRNQGFDGWFEGKKWTEHANGDITHGRRRF